MRHIFSALILICLGCRSTPSPTPTNDLGPALSSVEGPIRLTVVGTNDWHGWVMAQSEPFPRGTIRFGGFAAFAGYLKILRSHNPGGVIVLDAGDMFQGTLASNLTEGAVVIEAMGQVGYDAAAVGNHEFDYGPTGSVSVATQPSMDSFGALKERLKQAKFPLLSANIYEAESGHRPGWLDGEGAVVIDRAGLKVGLLGLTTPQTPTTTVPVNVASLKFGSLAPEALTGANRLRQKGAQVVIAVVHAGGRCPQWKDPNDLSGCEPSEIFEMLRGLPEGTLDAVVAGHTHAVLGHFISGVPVIESGAFGRAFGTIELFVDRHSLKVLKEKTVIRPAIAICETVDRLSSGCDVHALKAHPDAVEPVRATFEGEQVVADAQVDATVAAALAQVRQLQERRLGVSVPKTLDREYENESALGDFLADSLRAMEKADVALLNPGGLRADLREGEVTYGGVYEVMPFDNTVATLNLSADELKRLLTAAYSSRKGVFQVSGLEVTLSRCPGPSRLLNVALENGKSLDSKAHYRVVMPDFLARGGDGLSSALQTFEPTQVDMGESRELNLRDALVEHWQKKKPPFVAPKRGRVRFKPSTDDCSAAAQPSPATASP